MHGRRNFKVTSDTVTGPLVFLSYLKLFQKGEDFRGRVTTRYVLCMQISLYWTRNLLAIGMYIYYIDFVGFFIRMVMLQTTSHGY